MSAEACEGVFALHKPPAITSAQVIRDAQEQFDASDMFKPWIESQKAKLVAESHNQKQKRRNFKARQALKVKMGHGGTLDPMATGVLILGVGSGTKSLNRFLECTKSYDTVVLFGATTDSYDSEGKIVARKPYQHVTREKVEQALLKFRGKIMQRPPIFSAIRIQGKRLYEYAREGKELPRDILERPVEVEELELVEWYEGGTHPWHWPTAEADVEEKVTAEKLLNVRTEINNLDGGDDALKAKRQKLNPDSDSSSVKAVDPETQQEPDTNSEPAPCPAPACRIRMTVTSGFYVRSLCHDLGVALDSYGLMSSLVRTRQSDFELGKNVLAYADLAKGESVWSPQVQEMLATWRKENPFPTERPQQPKHIPSSKRPEKQSPAQNSSRERRNSSSGEE